MLLVKFDSNYADEFDIGGFIVMSEEDWEKHNVLVKKKFDEEGEIEVYFGTNESMIWESYESYIGDFYVNKLSDEELKALKKLFGPNPSSGSVVMIDTDEDDE